MRTFVYIVSFIISLVSIPCWGRTVAPGPEGVCQLEVNNGEYGDSPFIIGDWRNECSITDLFWVSYLPNYSKSTSNFVIDPETDEAALTVLFRPEGLYFDANWGDMKRAQPQTISTPLSTFVPEGFKILIAGYQTLYYEGGDTYDRCVGENCNHYAHGGCDGGQDLTSGSCEEEWTSGDNILDDVMDSWVFWKVPNWQKGFLEDDFSLSPRRGGGYHAVTNPFSVNSWENHYSTFIHPMSRGTEPKNLYAPAGESGPKYPYAVDITIDTCGADGKTPEAGWTVIGQEKYNGYVTEMEWRDMRIHLKCGWIKLMGLMTLKMKRVEIFVEPKCEGCVPQVFELDRYAGKETGPYPVFKGLRNGSEPFPGPQWYGLHIHPHSFTQTGHRPHRWAPKYYAKYNHHVCDPKPNETGMVWEVGNSRAICPPKTGRRPYRCVAGERWENCRIEGINDNEPNKKMRSYFIRKITLDIRIGEDQEIFIYEGKNKNIPYPLFLNNDYELANPETKEERIYTYRGRPVELFLPPVVATAEAPQAPIYEVIIYETMGTDGRIYHNVGPSGEGCVAGELWNPELNQCVCPTSATDGTCLVCAGGQEFSEGACVCPEGEEWVDGLTRCEAACNGTRNELDPSVCMITPEEVLDENPSGDAGAGVIVDPAVPPSGDVEDTRENEMDAVPRKKPATPDLSEDETEEDDTQVQNGNGSCSLLPQENGYTKFQENFLIGILFSLIFGVRVRTSTKKKLPA